MTYLTLFITDFAKALHNDLLENKGLLSRIAKSGHVGKRVFQATSYQKMRFSTWFYTLMCIALPMTQNDFLKLWMKLGEYIFMVAEEHGDELIEEHRRKKKGSKESPKAKRR